VTTAAIGAVVGALVGTGALLYWLVRKVQRLRAEALAQIESDVLRGRPAVRVDQQANFFGVESKGVTQMRGNGTLVLTADELVFALWLPRTLVRIPLRDIVTVDEAKSHLGKSIARSLLRVRWRTAGIEDTVAWWVPDLAGWTADLRGASTVRPRD
jgi:hypothetical protein